MKKCVGEFDGDSFGEGGECDAEKSTLNEEIETLQNEKSDEEINKEDNQKTYDQMAATVSQYEQETEETDWNVEDYNRLIADKKAAMQILEDSITKIAALEDSISSNLSRIKELAQSIAEGQNFYK